MSVTDLPDYTGYSDIENVYGDVKIYTPSGLWVVGSDIITSAVAVSLVAPAGQSEETIVEITGRVRVKSIGFWIYTWGISNPADPYDDGEIRVYRDGETDPSFKMLMADIDGLNGYLAARKIQTNVDVFTAENPLDTTETHDATILRAVNPRGGLLFLVADRQASALALGTSYVCCGFVNPDIECLESAKITFWNDNSDTSKYLTGWFTVEYGEYP